MFETVTCTTCHYQGVPHIEHRGIHELISCPRCGILISRPIIRAPMQGGL